MGSVGPAVMGFALRGAGVWIRVLGCRSNLCEGEFLAGEIEARGGVLVDKPSMARAAVIVTCSVTAEAGRKCRQLVRRARRAVGDDGIVAVCGCWGQGTDAAQARGLGVDILAGSRGKRELPAAIEGMLESGRSFLDMRYKYAKSWDWEELPLKSPVLHTRAFVKVQDGCDHFCSYCVIPFLRGRPVSRPMQNVIAEIERVAESGCGEVVLTGINLGGYGRDIGLSLAALIREVSRVPGVRRLRLGSLEPFSLNEELIAALEESPAFCPHLHLPMQSGDDGVLSMMRRGYTADGFAGICDAARKRLGDDLHISSDVIVGFPGETGAAFQNTLSLMRRAGIGRAHIFPFSARRGTVAERLPGAVPPQIIAERAAEAAELGAGLLSRYAGRFVGRCVDVLVEEEKAGHGRGHTPHFLEAVFGGGYSRGSLIKIRADSCGNGVISGAVA